MKQIILIVLLLVAVAAFSQLGPPSGGGSGTGTVTTTGMPTTGALPKFTGATSIGNSNITENADGTDQGIKALLGATPSTPTFNAGGTTTCDFSASNGCFVTAVGGNTTMAYTNLHAGGWYWLKLLNDTTARTWTEPGTALGLVAPAVASTYTTQWLYSPDGTNLVAANYSSETPSILRFQATRAAPTQAGCTGGGCFWIDSTDNDYEFYMAGGGATPFKGFLAGVDANPVTGQLSITTTTCTSQFVSAISARGVGTCATPASTTIAGQTVTYGGTYTPYVFTPIVNASTATDKLTANSGRQFFATTGAIPANTITQNTHFVANVQLESVNGATAATGNRLRLLLCTATPCTAGNSVTIGDYGGASGTGACLTSGTCSATLSMDIYGTAAPGASVQINSTDRGTILRSFFNNQSSVVAGVATNGPLWLGLSWDTTNTQAADTTSVMGMWMVQGL